MGHQFTIEGDEVVALATALAELRGQSLEAAVTEAVRERLEAERKMNSEMTEIEAMITDFHSSLTGPLPSSDHSFLYDDETGLPV